MVRILPGMAPLACILAGLLIAACAGLGAPLAAQEVLDAGDATLVDLGETASTIAVSSSLPVQSVTIALSHDPTLVEAVSIAALGPALAAEGVYSNLIPSAGGVLVAIIADVAPPFDGQTLPPLAAEPLVAISWRPAIYVAAAQTTPLAFVDGVFDNPPVTNTIVQAGGIVVTQAQGLALDGGTLTLLPPSPPTFRIEPRTLAPDEIGEIAVRLDNPTGPVEAYSLAVSRPAGLEFLAVVTDGTVAESLAAELIAPDLLPTGATLLVVLDAAPPFAGQTIPIGAGIPIAFIAARCLDSPLAPSPATAETVGFAVPGATNEVIIDGTAIPSLLVPGDITCLPVPLSLHVFLAGAAGPGGTIVPVSAAPGETAPIGFWYTDPVGGIEGLQLAVCIPCTMNFVPNSFSAIGGALDEAEFLLATYDNDPGDGDGCEMTVGALLDALPPLDGATLPATTVPVALGSVELAISSAATPFDCLPVSFCDFIGGAGGVPIENVAIVGGESLFNFVKVDGEVCLDAGIPFRRGDANLDGTVDLADPIATISALFGLAAPLACPAAADSDGGGALDIADPVLILEHLFAGGPPPAAPYPACGVSPGEDCPAFGVCP